MTHQSESMSDYELGLRKMASSVMVHCYFTSYLKKKKSSRKKYEVISKGNNQLYKIARHEESPLPMSNPKYFAI